MANNNVTARIKKEGKNFEILVDLDKAIAFKKTGQGSVNNILAFPNIFSDAKKGLHVPAAEMKSAFGTDDTLKVAEIILTKGELMLPTEYRTKQRDEKKKQIINWLSQNCLDPRTGAMHTPARIESAMEDAGVRIEENESAESQSMEIIKIINKLIPIKLEKKKIMLKIPAQFTGKAYSVLKEFMIKEEWLSDGSLQCVVEIPAGLAMTFFDKLNAITHGETFSKDLSQ
jgi:ribosome maturation protein SDO1